MQCLDSDVLAAIDRKTFRARNPFPWVNPQGCIRDEAFDALVADLPKLEMFTPFFNKQRKHGQAQHDRYVLEYVDGLDIPPLWQQLVNELRSDLYRDFVSELLGHRHFRLRFHWHYTPASCEVSPHCDSSNKLGSQIFYLNTWDNWDPAWGGETVILDDQGRFGTDTNPQFADFDAQWPAEIMDNRSIIFGRRGNSWHGVRAIDCPEGKLRQVFIVVFEDWRSGWMLIKRATRLLKGKPMVSKKERGMF